MEIHPVAEMFPLLEGEDFDALVADIKISGLRQPIIVDKQGRVLDGRNRLRACEQLGIEPEVEVYEGDDVVEFIWSLNDQRRHLTKWQRAMCLVRASKSENLSNMTESIVGILERDISRTTYQDAKMVARWSSSLIDGCIAGSVGYAEAIAAARGEKAKRASEDHRFDELKARAPDLADQVTNETLALGEAYAAALQRDRERAEQQKSDTEFLVKHIGALARLTGGEKATVANFNSAYGTLTEEQIAEAGKVLTAIKRYWKARRDD